MFKRLDTEGGRRRREETTTQIRKSKKEEQLMKRRQIPQRVEADDKLGKDKTNFTATDLPMLMGKLNVPGQSEVELLSAVKGIRRMLSVEVNPPVKEVLEVGALPHLVKFLESSNTDLIFEAAWALTNIASTNMTKSVVEGGATNTLVRLLQHGDHQVREQAAWCLGNIAGDCHELRDHVLNAGALHGLVLNINDPHSVSLLSNVTWALSNLCRGKPSPPKHLIEPAIVPLASLLSRNVGEEVHVDAAWALSYLADGDNDRIQMVMDTNITGILINFLAKDHLPLMTPTVRTLGNFVTGTDTQTQAAIDAGVITQVARLLHHPNRNLRKETCWLLSNIAAGTLEQIDALFKETGLLERVTEVAREDRWEIRREAIWVVSNIFTTGNNYHIRSLVQRDGLQVLVDAMDSKDPKIIMVALEAVEKTLHVGEELNLGYNNLMDEYHGIDILEVLQEHPNDDIYRKAVDILERFFNAECDDEDENVAPSANEDGFVFGMPPSKQLFPENESIDYGPTSSQQVLGGHNYDFSMGMHD